MSEHRASMRGAGHTNTAVVFVSWSKWTTSGDGEWVIFVTAVDILSLVRCPFVWKACFTTTFCILYNSGHFFTVNIRSSREGLRRSRQCSEACRWRPSIFLVQEQSSVPSAVSQELAPERRATWRALLSDKGITVKTHLLEMMVES